MARTAREMADKIMEMYRDRGNRYRLTENSFKDVAGKARLRNAYLTDVDAYLREDGYVIIDLRQEHGYLAIVRQSVPMRYDDASDEARTYYYTDDEEDEEE
jgi:hypothetical protein